MGETVVGVKPSTGSLSRLLRARVNLAHRPVPARECDRWRRAVYAITDVRTGHAHLVTDAGIAGGRLTGRYLAVCGTEVLAASLTAEATALCRSCRTEAGR